MKALYVVMLAAVATLTGCQPTPGTPASEWQYMPDQALRAERFDACMKALPAGPVSTHYNDWSEVVDSCADSAYRQSLRLAKVGKDGISRFQDGSVVK